MLPLLKYTVFRLALFVGAFGLLAWLKAGPVTALIGAAVISFLLSYLLLRGPRTQLAEQIAEYVDRRHLRHSPAEDDSAVEDAAIEGSGSGESSGESKTSDSPSAAGQAPAVKKGHPRT